MKVGLAVAPGRSPALKADIDPAQLACVSQQPKMFGTNGQDFGSFGRGQEL
jgi:hypothetical protein